MPTSDSDSAGLTTGDLRPRVLVLESQMAILGDVDQLLEKEFTVTGWVLDAESAVDEWRRTNPSVIVLGLAIGSGGFETAARLRSAGCTAPFVFVSADEAPEVVRAAWRAGGLGFVARRDVTWDLVRAIRAAFHGQRYISTALEPR